MLNQSRQSSVHSGFLSGGRISMIQPLTRGGVDQFDEIRKFMFSDRLVFILHGRFECLDARSHSAPNGSIEAPSLEILPVPLSGVVGIGQCRLLISLMNRTGTPRRLTEVPGTTFFPLTFFTVSEVLHPASGKNGTHLNFSAAGAGEFMRSGYGSCVFTQSGHGALLLLNCMKILLVNNDRINNSILGPSVSSPAGYSPEAY